MNEKCVKVSGDLNRVMSRCASSEAWTIARSVTCLEEVEVYMGNNIHGATWMHEPETSKWREPGEIGDLAAEGESESLNLEKVQRSQTCRLCCTFSSRMWRNRWWRGSTRSSRTKIISRWGWLHTRSTRPNKHKEDGKWCTFRWKVDHVCVYGELLATTRKMQAVRQAEDNLNQKQMEKSEACGSSRVWRRSSRKWLEHTRTHREVDEDATSEDRRDESLVIR